jgi:group I intron endonuclease
MSKRFIINEIRSLDNNITYSYVGSTQNFSKRKSRHKQNCNDGSRKDHNIHLYKFIREYCGWDNFEMVPLEEYECDTILQSRIREQFWIDRIKSMLNSRKAFSGFDTKENYNTKII